ncbi:hypothetical protein [Sphingomonas xanthus]|uniref:Uncharacterized protein n=1 Tax=Sphingomonas xanthus TaxID=2594473 RepID=A0A516IP51_9SPHN|nr:hypothetical protein [Sphingomonas xanthus]QDP18695.1 hypothetical protein FMM02_01210 [Sphingomonas xanthus]
MSYAAMILLLASETAAGCSMLRQQVDFESAKWPLYESINDPPGQRPTRALIENGVVHLGGIDYSRDELLQSDVGFSLIFEKVEGGIRARRYPIVFPASGHMRFEFHDYVCSAEQIQNTVKVKCRDKKSNRSYSSLIANGGLMSFETTCIDHPSNTCTYKLVDGEALRPSQVQDSSQ